MRISFLRVILILVFAIIVALIINYLQPNSLPLINKTNNFALQDQSINNSPVDTSGDFRTNQNIDKDQNKTNLESNKDNISDQISPEYNFSDDSSVQNGNQNKVYSKDEDMNLSNLTTAVFNQPRLVSLSQAYELYRQKIVFVDARDVEQFAKGHIAGAINIPYFSIDDFISSLNGLDKTDPIVTYCEGADCDMSIRLGNELFTKGFKKVFVFFGGWEEWEKSGYPVVTSDSDIRLN